MWQHQGQGGWYFVSLPKEISKEIRENLKLQEEGWGRMKATASINQLEWDTAIWLDKKQDTYLLPIKGDIRKKGKLELKQILQVSVSI